MKRLIAVVGLVTSLVVPVSTPALAGDDVENGKIVFSGEVDGAGDLFVMNSDGSGAVNITNSSDRDEGAPRWSPDGSRILFLFSSIPTDGGYGIGIVDTDGGDFFQVTSTTDGFGSPAHWSSDGDWVVYAAHQPVLNSIWKIRSDGTDETLLVEADARTGSWSPDGTRIAISSKGLSTGGYQVVLIDPDGTNPVELTSRAEPGTYESNSPAFAPDGGTIAFVRLGDSDNELWTMNPDGTSKQKLLADSTLPIWPVEWSPDGTKILVELNGEPSVVPPSGGGPSVLPSWSLPAGAASASDFDWQPVLQPVLCNGVPATIVGTGAGETLVGTSGADVIHGLGGNDVIKGLGGDDVICGGSGADTLTGGGGNDVLNGGNGTDTVVYSDATRSVTVDLGAGTASGRGNDTVKNVERVIGSDFRDTLTGDSGRNKLWGGSGSDVLFGGGGKDWLFGEKGADVLRGNGGADVLKGNRGPDTLFGGVGIDDLNGGPGTDSCVGETLTNCET